MTYRLIRLFAIPILLLGTLSAAGQSGKISKSRANDYYQKGNYELALEQYKALLKSDDKNIEYNFRIGVCYLKTNIDKGLAVGYFKNVINLDALDNQTDYQIAYYLLGRAYHSAYKFDEAIEQFRLFMEQEDVTEEDLAFAKQKIQFCFNAKELIKYPVTVNFENLGDNINSPYPDYFPFVPEDESFITFNTKRNDGSKRLQNGSYYANIYVAQVKNGKFKKAKQLEGEVNTKDGNEDVIGLSSDGQKMLFFIDNEDDYGDLFMGDYDGKKVKGLEKLDKQLISLNEEVAASITGDRNTMYVASNRKGGYGGLDIYVSKKLPTGQWSEPMNLGPTVNTDKDEDFPNISPDGKTLYFSSEGHTSMGGLDIFKVEWDPKAREWVGLKNMGYPVNTPEDNMNLRLSTSGKYGYMSAVRPGGYGDHDIYRVDFNEVDPRYTVLLGKMYAVNTSQLKEDVYITVTDQGSGELFGTYLPNSVSGRYVIIVPPGKYTMEVEADGYNTVVEEVEIFDKSSYQTVISKDLVLKPRDILMKLPQMDL